MTQTRNGITIKRDPHRLLTSIAIAFLSVAILAVFIDNKLCVIFGPIIALLLCYLFFFGYSETVIAIVLVANDALGTIAFGKISFPYLLLVLVAIKFVMGKSYSVVEYAFIVVSALLACQLFFLESISLKQVLYSVAFIVALVLIGKSKEGRERFFQGVALTVVLISLHTCITGGVEFYSQNQFSEEYLRKGILGVGIGDSNYSCFLLNVGLICLWYDDKTHWGIKTIATLPILYAMTVTLSTSGILSLIIILALGILLGKNKPKATVLLLIVVLVIVMVFSLYIGLPSEMHLESVDAYILRMTEKLNALVEGNLDEATTNRSGLLVSHLQYYVNQPLIKMLFGGNGVIAVDNTAPHNTYIGYLLQIGLVGTFFFFGYAAVRFIKCCNKKTDFNNWRRSILLKVLCLFVATNLSLCEGSLWSMWMYFLFIL